MEELVVERETSFESMLCVTQQERPRQNRLLTSNLVISCLSNASGGEVAAPSIRRAHGRRVRAQFRHVAETEVSGMFQQASCDPFASAFKNSEDALGRIEVTIKDFVGVLAQTDEEQT